MNRLLTCDQPIKSLISLKEVRHFNLPLPINISFVPSILMLLWKLLSPVADVNIIIIIIINVLL